MVELLESVDCMVRNAPYRKFRPDVSVHSSVKLWSVENLVLELHFETGLSSFQVFLVKSFVFPAYARWRYAFNSILEVHIRRFSKMWSWSNIRKHRENLKAYKTAYRTKLLSQNKPNQDTERHIQVLLTD